MPQSNPKVTNIPINAAGGALTLIATTIMCSKVEVQEDPNFGAAVGLRGYYMDPESNHANPARDNPTEQTWLANTAGENGKAYQPIIFGGSDGRVHGAYGNYVGAQGTPLLELVSVGATATGVLLVEWP